ncbi:AAEL015150-PA [Aedes aegypti]|uniref:AAEL015150-PA n=1 Tax=Aedes aegypti TaxID=7159 RepID=Q16EI7_AEDAE|nr:AAEL015150-PA [Aedes aegypti]
MLIRALLLLWIQLARTALQINHHTTALIETTVQVLQRSFQDPFAAACIVWKGSTPETELLLGDLLDAVIVRLSGSIPVQLNVVEVQTQRRPWVRNVLLVDDYEAFRELRSDLSIERNDFSGRYLIVVNSAINETFVQKVFIDLWKLQIANVVLIGIETSQPKLWTYFPFSDGICGQARSTTLTLEDDLYPDKISNFHGCQLKVGSFETRPFTIMDRSDEEKLRMSGFEGELLDLLKTRLNFTTKIYEPENGEQWGYALQQNSTGLVRMIQEEEVDFGISCMGISVARNEVLKPGIAHYTTALVLAVPKGRPYTAIEKLFHPFQIEVWWCITTVLLGSTIVIASVERANENVRNFVYGNRVQAPYLNLIRIFFAISMERLPTRNFARTLLFYWIFFCFVIQSLYQGALYRYLQKDSTLPPSKTMAEIDRTDALYFVVESAERYYSSFPHRYKRVHHLPQEKNNIINRLKWMMHHPETSNVVMGALDHMAHHNHLYRRKGGFIDVCREFVSTYTVAIYYPKRSMLTNRFDWEIMRIQASGLMSYWINRYGDYDFFRKVNDASHPKKLSWEHLSAVFEICGVLLGLCGVVFLLEIVSDRYISMGRVYLKLYCRRRNLRN